MKHTYYTQHFDLKKLNIPDYGFEEGLYLRSTKNYPTSPRVQENPIFTFLEETIRPYSIEEFTEDSISPQGETKEFD